MKKRGISTIVASVLVVLITVAAATLLWTMIIPMISKSAFIEDPNLRFEIDTKTSYTVYDNENGFLNIRIKRGADTSEVTALKFIIGVEGSSISRRISNEEVVLPNTAKIYQFAIGFYSKIDQVKVAPIFLYKGEEIEGRMYALEQRIPVKPNILDDQVGDGDIQGVEVSEGLVLYYSFDEEPRVLGTSGDPQVFDYSGYGHAGSIPDYGTTNNVEFLKDGGIPNRNLGGAYKFDGNGDYLALTTFGTADGLATTDKTISFWAKPECKLISGFPDNRNSVIFGSFDNYFLNFLDVCNDDGSDALEFWYENSGGAPRYFDFGAVAEGEWNHYVITIDYDDVSDVDAQLYINGNAEGSILINTNGYGASNTNFYFGSNAHNPSENSFNGTVDEFRAYDKALSPEEISELYGIGSD